MVEQPRGETDLVKVLDFGIRERSWTAEAKRARP